MFIMSSGSVAVSVLDSPSKGCRIFTRGRHVAVKVMDSSTSKFTTWCLCFGVAAQFAFLPFLGPSNYWTVMQQAGFSTVIPEFAKPSPTTKVLNAQSAIVAAVVGALGLGLLYLSSRLDFVNDEDDPFPGFAWPVAGFVGVSLLALPLFQGIVLSLRDKSYDFFEILLMPILFALSAVVSTAMVLYLSFCLGAFWAGLIAVPRLIYVFTRTHRLRAV